MTAYRIENGAMVESPLGDWVRREDLDQAHLAEDLAEDLVNEVSEDNLRLQNRIALLLNRNADLQDRLEASKRKIQGLGWAATAARMRT